ncbi:hypothetical protein ALC53_01814, partial [Atta colombica]
IIILSRVTTNYITCHDKTMIIILTNSYLRTRICSLTKAILTFLSISHHFLIVLKYSLKQIELVKLIIINFSMHILLIEEYPAIGYSCRIEVQISKYFLTFWKLLEEWAIESEIAKQAKITGANMQVIVYVTRFSQPLFYTFNDGSSSFAHRSTQTKTLTRSDLSSTNRIIRQLYRLKCNS